MLRCAHISDLHFGHPTWNPLQFFSKRWIGNLNLLFSRRKEFSSQYLDSLIDTFKRLRINCVFITGDLSCTSLKIEFLKAKAFVETLKEANMQVFVVPGNHDQYTRKDYRSQTFYSFFEDTFSTDSTLSLKRDKVAARYLGHQWWLVGLDTALATPLFAAYGSFSAQIERKLRETLSSIPKEHHILLLNHFPMFKQPSPRNTLRRYEALQDLLQEFPNVRFYLHGHTHRHCIADLRSNNLPIVLDSGSTAHHRKGSWNLIEIASDRGLVETYHLDTSKEGHWHADLQCQFNW